MSRRTDEIFTCDFCGKEYKTEAAHMKCVLSHDIVYVPFERGKLKLLIKSILEASYAGFYFEEDTVKKLLNYRASIKR